MLYLFSGGRANKLGLVQRGEAPTEFYYGYCELVSSGNDVDFLDIPEVTQGSISSRLLNHFYYRWQVLPCRTTGDLITILYQMLGRLNTYDVIVGTTTGLGFSLEILRRVGLLKSRVLTIHCGVMNYRYNGLTNAVTGHLLRRGFTQVLGQGELEAMGECYRIDKGRLELNEFGVDNRFWFPLEEPDDGGYVLSVGNSGRRDYELLMRVAAGLGVQVKLLTESPPPSVPDNVTVIRGRMYSNYELPDIELRELYRRASVVVVPLTDSLQPSGQSVTLQAMACAKVVVLTRTRGMWNPSILRDGVNCLLVPAADEKALGFGIRRALDDSKWRYYVGANAVETVRNHWDIDQFSEKLNRACERIHQSYVADK